MKTLKNSSKEDQNSLIPGLYENRIASCSSSSLFGVMASSMYKKCNLGKHLNNFIGFFSNEVAVKKLAEYIVKKKVKKTLDFSHPCHLYCILSIGLFFYFDPTVPKTTNL